MISAQPLGREKFFWECQECHEPVKDPETGKLLDNCTKSLHINHKQPGDSNGTCVKLDTGSERFKKYQDAYDYYAEGAIKKHPWEWAASTKDKERLKIGEKIKMICPDCPGGSHTFTRR